MEQNNNIHEIDLANIDWNNLSPEEFQNLSLKISERDKILKEKKERKPRILSNNIPVILRGNSYELSSSVVERLKNMKSGKSKEKLIAEILLNNKPILSI